MVVNPMMSRLKHAWNAFTQSPDNHPGEYGDWTSSYSGVPFNGTRVSTMSDRSIVGSIYTRLGIDVSAVPILHIKKDEDGRYEETVNSGLNNCLNLEANVDQAGRAFRQDVAMSLFEKGVIAIVPVDTTVNPTTTGSYDILSMRVGEILAWWPQHVTVSVYDERVGRREQITLPKRSVAIVVNPLYSVMNEPNSTLQRLIRKLSLLDAVDEQSSSGKLDLIIQLPYVIKSDARRREAEKRRKDIEMQLKGSQYGIAYADGTEKITQLNRPAENNLMNQVEYLTAMLYSQLGLTKEVFDGTADEKTMLNYHNRTIDPILTAITEALKRTFLTKTARTQGHSIEYIRDPFKFVGMAEIAEIADKFTRNEIASPNDIRSVLGMKPSKDSKSDELRNRNMPAPNEAPAEGSPPPSSEALKNETEGKDGGNQNGS